MFSYTCNLSYEVALTDYAVMCYVSSNVRSIPLLSRTVVSVLAAWGHTLCASSCPGAAYAFLLVGITYLRCTGIVGSSRKTVLWFGCQWGQVFQMLGTKNLKGRNSGNEVSICFTLLPSFSPQLVFFSLSSSFDLSLHRFLFPYFLSCQFHFSLSSPFRVLFPPNSIDTTQWLLKKTSFNLLMPWN